MNNFKKIRQCLYSKQRWFQKYIILKSPGYECQDKAVN